jgi:hypothetical protein
MSKAFLRSVSWWQDAMMAALPYALFNGVDIEEAYGHLPAAQVWLERIRTIETSVAEEVREVEEQGKEARVVNLKTLLSSLRYARENAEKHVELLTKRSSARAARRGRRGRAPAG